MEINFKPDKDKKDGLAVRIDNLEVRIFISASSEYIAEIFIYENRFEVPCEYEDCPQKITSGCSFYTDEIEQCPFGAEVEEIDRYISFSNILA